MAEYSITQDDLASETVDELETLKVAVAASNAVAKQETSFVLHRSLHAKPAYVVGAQGNYLHLSNGQRILDASGGAAVACLGHGDAR